MYFDVVALLMVFPSWPQLTGFLPLRTTLPHNGCYTKKATLRRSDQRKKSSEGKKWLETLGTEGMKVRIRGKDDELKARIL